MLDVIFWTAFIYVADVYWLIKYVQLVRADLREGAEPNPVHNIIVID